MRRTWQEVEFSKTHETICVGVVLGFYQSPALFILQAIGASQGLCTKL